MPPICVRITYAAGLSLDMLVYHPVSLDLARFYLRALRGLSVPSVTSIELLNRRKNRV